MRWCKWVGMVALGLAVGVLQAGGGLKSGPQPGTLLPGSFQPYNLNGKIGKDRYHCLVCDFKLNPTVMVFAREKSTARDAGFADLLPKLDAAVERHKESYLGAFVVFLSPEARPPETEAKAEDPAKLVDQEAAWEALLTRLRPRAEKLKDVLAAVYPAEGPPGYNIAKDAEVTVILYRRHDVVANFAFAEGKLNEQAVTEVMKAVDAMARDAKTTKSLAKKKT